MKQVDNVKLKKYVKNTPDITIKSVSERQLNEVL